MKGIDRAFSIDREQLLGSRLHVVFCFPKFRMVRRRPFADLAGEISRQRVGQHEIAVSQALHEGARAEPICAVIGEIRFTDDVQSRDVAHQIVVHPQSAHRVMDRRIDSHRTLVGVFARDFFVDMKEISVAFADRFFSEPGDRVGEIQVNAAPALADAAAFIANFLGAREEMSRGARFPKLGYFRSR